MTNDLRARVAAATGLDPVIRDVVAGLVMEVVQPVADERDQLAAAIERVRIIHHRVECSNVRCPEGGWCIGCDPDGADDCSEHPWPCPTVLVVSPDGGVPALYARWVLRRDYDAVTAERDRLAAALRQHETCRTCSHERHEHDYDGVIRAQYCGRCTVGRDVHDFHPEDQP